MNTFNLKIVSFDKVVIDKPVVYCTVFTPSGKIGFKARHEAFVSVLKENSKVEYILENDESATFDVPNGLFSFKDNSCTLLIGCSSDES